MARARRSTGAGAARVLVDSGAWIALVRARDRRHDEAERMFQRALAEGLELVTTNHIVAEVQRFVLFHAGPRAAAFVVDRIGASPRTVIEFSTRAHHDRALAWLRKLADQRLSYTDAISFAVMEEKPCGAAMTFDRDFEAAGFEVWRADA